MNYRLNARTQALLEQWSTVSWFDHVSQPPAENWLAVESWDAAVVACSSVDYENFGIAKANYIRHVVRTASVERYQQWNTIVEAVRPRIETIVESAAPLWRVPEGHFQAIKDQVLWDLCHACLESEYSDVFSPGYYLDTASVYALGRFPCGWQGEYPNGQRVVY